MSPTAYTLGTLVREPLIRRHEAAIDGDTGLLVAEPVRARTAADGDEEQVRLDGGAALELDGHDVALLPRPGEPDTGAGRRCRACGRRVAAGSRWPRPRPRPAAVVPRRWSPPIRTSGTPTRTRRRSPRRPGRPPGPGRGRWSRLVAGHDPTADLQARQRLRVGAGGQHDVAAGDAATVDIDGVGAAEPTRALDELDRPRRTRGPGALCRAAPRRRPCRRCTPLMSTDSKVVLMPNRLPSQAESAASAAWRRALVGMQPLCRQVPPSLPFSTRATESPSSAALRAHAYPPLPPPRTTTS